MFDSYEKSLFSEDKTRILLQIRRCCGVLFARTFAFFLRNISIHVNRACTLTQCFILYLYMCCRHWTCFKQQWVGLHVVFVGSANWRFHFLDG